MTSSLGLMYPAVEGGALLAVSPRFVGFSAHVRFWVISFWINVCVAQPSSRLG